jgi:tetratricopeptide (TPR) repeat protein
LLLCLIALRPIPLLSHGDAHVQILELTRQIEREPGKADLYFKRGELNRVHGLWDAAQADFDRAAALDPKLEIVDLARGRLFLEANWPLSANIALDRYLSRQPNNVEALVTRARVLVKLQQPLLAAQDYSRAIASATDSRPELYLERAQVLTTEGGPHLAEALRGLEEGIKKLGPLVTLQLYALDVELKQKRFDAALARLDRLAEQFPRQETWLARRGEILQQAGRRNEAREAFKATLKAIAALPASRRQVPAMIELDKRVRLALDQLANAEREKNR